MKQSAKKSAANVFLEELPSEAKEALEHLCKLGCDKGELGSLLYLLSLSNETITVGRPGTSQRMISFNASDSYETAFQGLSRKALNSKACEAKRIAKAYRFIWETYQETRKTMLQLRTSPGVQWLIQLGVIRQGSSLHSDSPLSRSLSALLENPLEACPTPERFESHLAGLIQLPAAAKLHIGEKQRPHLARRLIAIYAHIFEATGRFQDDLLQNILFALSVRGIKVPPTAFALKEWRKRHKLRRPKASRKR